MGHTIMVKGQGLFLVAINLDRYRVTYNMEKRSKKKQKTNSRFLRNSYWDKNIRTIIY